MKTSSLIKAFLILALIGAGGIFLFFYRLGSNDAKVLAEFPAAYHAYDQAAAAFFAAVTAHQNPDGFDRAAEAALAGLNAKASARISSLTRNDGAMMQVMAEIRDLSAQELAALKAYQSASAANNADADRLAQSLADLARRRQSAFARFLELAGLNP